MLQVLFHMLDAINVHVESTRASGRATSMPMKAEASMSTQAHSTSSAPGMINMGEAPPGTEHLSRDQQAVCKVIKSITSEQGCSFNDLESALKGQIELADIKKATEYLSSEGHIYPTIDDNHFQLCTG
eukprot:SAG31_NODE_1843_length_7106_cov_7.400742_5_plen_128_part_00